MQIVGEDIFHHSQENSVERKSCLFYPCSGVSCKWTGAQKAAEHTSVAVEHLHI